MLGYGARWRIAHLLIYLFTTWKTFLLLLLQPAVMLSAVEWAKQYADTCLNTPTIHTCMCSCTHARVVAQKEWKALAKCQLGNPQQYWALGTGSPMNQFIRQPLTSKSNRIVSELGQRDCNSETLWHQKISWRIFPEFKKICRWHLNSWGSGHNELAKEGKETYFKKLRSSWFS
jgi:hypothetical protein